MERTVFSDHLGQATAALLTATRPCVVEHLPDPIIYLVGFGCSYDGNALEDDERTFPDDPSSGTPLGPWTVDQVITNLWRDGWVPEWIDMTVHAASDSFTTMLLECCGRFTTGTHLYHRQWKPPFSTKIGPLPPGLKDGERFSLNWKQSRNRC